jgi:hypothetical protein
LRPMRLSPALNICLFAAIVACGCRWSHQSYPSAYEGEVRFEHCYRLDEEYAQPQEVRHRCWYDWVHSYTYGQPRDRIDYATRRERALAQAQANGKNAPPASATVDPARARGPSSPTPTSAFAPPPRTVERDAAADAPASSAVAPDASNDALRRPAPGALCAGSCSAKWVECGQGCKVAACLTGCDSRYKSCMRGCF